MKRSTIRESCLDRMLDLWREFASKCPDRTFDIEDLVIKCKRSNKSSKNKRLMCRCFWLTCEECKKLR